MTRFRVIWFFINESLWFVPLVMGAAAVVAAVFLTMYHFTLPENSFGARLLFSGDLESARSLLSSLLSAMITMTSLVVSITIVVLTLAAGQLGPRVIRYFIGDRATQVVLGLFVSTILYILIVLRSLGGSDAVPHMAVTVGTSLSALSIFVLLFFLHRLAKSTMSDHVINIVDHSLHEAIADLLPEEGSRAPRREPIPSDVRWLPFSCPGYIQAIDTEKLVRCAREYDVQIWATVRAGDFLFSKGQQIGVTAAVTPPEALCAAIESALVIGPERSMTQDLEYGIRQMVEIALRALSPALNDPFTAIIIIDRLSSALSDIFERPPPRSTFEDEEGQLRLTLRPTTNRDVLDAAFDDIRHSARTSPRVMATLVEALSRLACYAESDDLRTALHDQLEKIRQSAAQASWAARDLEQLDHGLRRAREPLA